MTYAGIQMFVEKLNQLINCNDIPLVNNPEIVDQRPQFQLLYEELVSMIQTLFIDQHQDLEIVKDLKQRFTDAAEEAQYIVDLFLSGVHIRSNGHSPTSDDFNRPLNLDNVRISLKFIKVEFQSMRIDSMKMDSSPRPQRTLNQSVAGQSSISRRSKKLLDEINLFVGIDRDAELIRDKLVEDQKKLDVVSIVGMGGIGKTTLATKVFNDPFVKYHFYIRVWVTVSQTYDRRVVLTQIVESICGQLDLEDANDSRLRELVHKNLMGKRYLIVIDDIWHTETWDSLKVFFPHDNIGSRILLTSRLTEVAKHANSDGLIHHLGYLNKEKSWELLCQKVFQGNECPKWSMKPGMQIVENCHGLPLALVIIAGVLANEAWNEKFWEEIAWRTGSYVGDQNAMVEIFAISYHHLPLHLRECLLYFGGFPEDYMFEVQRLIWLWVAEGFIQVAENRRLEDIAEAYLMELIDRNLVIVAQRSKSNGSVKACKVHDLVRELCTRKAKDERFILQTERLIFSSQFSDVIKPPYKPVRMFINDIYNSEFILRSTQNLRSILCFRDMSYLSDGITKYLWSFVLLRVLDLQKCELKEFPKAMELLVHLTYLVIWNSTKKFPSAICNLWGLQTLIYITDQSSRVVLPSNISDLVNLRHLWSYHPYTRERIKRIVFLPSIEKPMKLQTISGVVLGDKVDNFQKCFPYIKELTCGTSLDEQTDFKFLTYLEKLKLTVHDGPKGKPKNHITFPATLKSLTLAGCGLAWSDMVIIQSLPNLQVLKLDFEAFSGSCWNTDGQEFPQLKFLRLRALNIKQWEVDSRSFPCLGQLQISSCFDLEEIPLKIGDIPTLELIQIKECSNSVAESVRRIEEDQHDYWGNYHLKIAIIEGEKGHYNRGTRMA